MQFDMSGISKENVYKLLVATIGPRPVAWVTTQDTDGTVNAAPFSFFNAVGVDPPLVVLGILTNPNGTMKHTAQNIRDTGEFVVSLVCEPDAERMNLKIGRAHV